MINTMAAASTASFAFSPPVFHRQSLLRLPLLLPNRRESSSVFSVESLRSSNQVFWLSAVENPSGLPPASGDDGGVFSTVESVLFFIALIALSVVTVGVMYIAVTDFLDKREREKFEKEEEAANKRKKKQKSGRKAKVAALGSARNGPRGFGQQQEQDS